MKKINPRRSRRNRHGRQNFPEGSGGKTAAHRKLLCYGICRSAGSTLKFNGKDYVVEELNEHSFDKPIDIALFSAGGGTSEKFAPIAAAHGCIVIDNSSQWRMDPAVPLIVPEVNPEDISWHKNIIAQPQLLHHSGNGCAEASG